MTKDRLWNEFCRKNPHFLDEGQPSRLTVRGLKKLFDQTFEAGVREGERETRAEGVFMQSVESFRSVFGRKS